MIYHPTPSSKSNSSYYYFSSPISTSDAEAFPKFIIVIMTKMTMEEEEGLLTYQVNTNSNKKAGRTKARTISAFS